MGRVAQTVRATVSEADFAIAHLHARGRRLHPRLPLDQATFALYLGRCGGALGEAAIEAHAGDLYLAAAALTGQPAAVAELTGVCWPVALRYLLRVASGAEL